MSNAYDPKRFIILILFLQAILAAQTKAFQNNANNASYRHKVVEEPKVTHKVGALNLSS